MFGPRTLTLVLVPTAIIVLAVLLIELPPRADAASGPAHCQCVYDTLSPKVTQDTIAHCICGNMDCVAILPQPSSANHETSSLMCK